MILGRIVQLYAYTEHLMALVWNDSWQDCTGVCVHWTSNGFGIKWVLPGSTRVEESSSLRFPWSSCWLLLTAWCCTRRRTQCWFRSVARCLLSLLHVSSWGVILTTKKLRSRCGEPRAIKDYPFKACNRSKYSHACFTYCQELGYLLN